MESRKARELISIENVIQSEPVVVKRDERPKHMGTFPYPYMNGRLHLGHFYTIIRIEFRTRYMELKGYNSFFPFSFHITGMPIVASAKKLKKELDEGTAYIDIKSVGNILKSGGVPDEEIPNFIDPIYWPTYFVPLAKEDLRKLGVMVDFDRSFVTTDLNPYYDSFIKWQFNTLNKKGHLKFGKKYVIYSVEDKQPCADHDRSKGEGISPKEYTLVTMKINNYFSDDTYLLCATLRPETMYGLTNVWIKPDFEYDICKVNGVRFIARSETFRNMKYQDNEIEFISKISGEELLGRKVNATYGDSIPILPMSGIKTTMGTGIVASVPADAPLDAVYYLDFINKEAKTEELEKIRNEMKEKDVPPVMEIDGNISVAFDTVMKEKLTPRNSKRIVELTADLYKKAHHMGKMVVGDRIKGTKASEYYKEKLISDGKAFKYAEPDGEVISRSGDKCIVSLTDQWFIKYGNEKVKERVRKHLETMKFQDESIKEQFKGVVEWLNEWPCTRTVGLGTKFLDTEFVIDSLSDSTIYMAFYTISHLVGKLPMENIDDNLWEFVFKNGEFPEKLNDQKDIIEEMKTEFNYWYPVDLRVSGKDLVGNHLVMSLFNHAMIWEDDFSKYPRRYLINGHALLNGEKMSKSTGNFMTIRQALDKFGSDATRLAMASSSLNTIGDSSFEIASCDASVLTLYTEMQIIKSIVDYEFREDHSNVWDKYTINKVRQCVVKTLNAFENEHYNSTVKDGFYAIINVRKLYQKVLSEKQIPSFSKYVIETIYSSFLTCIYPLCPHFSQSMEKFFKEKGFNVNISIPKDEDLVYDSILLIRIERILHSFHKICADYDNTKKKILKRGKEFVEPIINITICKKSHPRLIEYIESMKEKFSGKLEKMQNSKDKRKIMGKELMKYIKSKKETKPALKGFLSVFNEIITEFGEEYIDNLIEDKEIVKLTTEMLTTMLWKTKPKLKDVNIKIIEQSDNVFGCYCLSPYIELIF